MGKRYAAPASAGLLLGFAAALAACASSPVSHEASSGDGSAAASATGAADGGLGDPAADQTGDPALAGPATSEPYVEGAGGALEGPLLLGVSGLLAEDAAREPALAGAQLLFPLLAVRLEGDRWVPLGGGERRALARALGDPQALLFAEPDAPAEPLATDALVARARSLGAGSVSLIRFLGAGHDREATLILLDTATSRTVAVVRSLEPSLDVVGATLRGYLPPR